MIVSAVASAASAGAYSFQNITGNSATNAAAGEAQLSLLTFAVADPQLFRVTLSNGAGVASAVKAVFIDDSTGVLDSVDAFASTSGVSFRTGTNGSLPGGNSIASVFQENHDLGVRAKNPAPSNGINNGETLDWTYTISEGFSFADVEAAILAGTLRFGVHMISFPDGGSEAFVNIPNGQGDPNLVPTPMAALLGAGGLGLIGARRRRA